ncbi:hypothetical protein PAPYR_8884 [Paratrimastix pyriformis]|uniref:FAR-17a/AIG1-like protein n=1 Tax=Paratrimastix pyriformis TaxID=342808 RepID=A0ABQ8UB86_9EUKA|nr:hypothetical protein PAPYR_8884 [Paratrimastix pyriformis]
MALKTKPFKEFGRFLVLSAIVSVAVAMRFLYAEHENWIYSRIFGGRTRWITEWGRFFMELHLAVTFVLQIHRLVFAEAPLWCTKFVENLFCQVVAPTECFVVFTFWAISLSIPGGVVPPREDHPFPMGLNLYVHLWPVVYNLVVMWLYPAHHKRPLLPDLLVAVAVDLAYIAWTFYVVSVDGMWPYPVLTQVPSLGKAALFTGSVMVTICLLFAFRAVRSAMAVRPKKTH